MYQNLYALHFRFDDDNTGAERDGASFVQIANLIGIPQPEIYIIPRSEAMPAFEVAHKISEMVKHAKNSLGRSAIIIHYAGHGGEDFHGMLELSSAGGKKIATSRFVENIIKDYFIPLDQPIDFLMIFDCCYGFLPTRDTKPSNRLVELVGSGDVRDPIAFGAGVTNTLTSKILVEVRARAQQGYKRVEIAEIVASIQQNSPLKKPSHAAQVGTGSVTFAVNAAAAATTNTPSPNLSPAPGMLATFSMHVSASFTHEELNGLVKWIDELPKTPSTSLKLEGVKETASTLFIFESSILCFLRIRGLPGVVLICENSPADFSWLFAPRVSTQAPSSTSQRSRRPSFADENVPPPRTKASLE